MSSWNFTTETLQFLPGIHRRRRSWSLGTAMGTKMVVNFNNILMAKNEKRSIDHVVSTTDPNGDKIGELVQTANGFPGQR